MCVVIVLQGMHDLFPLIVLHGRDEFFSRPTLPVRVGDDDIVCAVDSVAKGTWCGVNISTGRAVFLTNFRTEDAPVDKPVKSRGTLVLDLLKMQDVGDLRREASQDLPIGINDVPGACGRFGRKTGGGRHLSPSAPLLFEEFALITRVKALAPSRCVRRGHSGLHTEGQVERESPPQGL